MKKSITVAISLMLILAMLLCACAKNYDKSDGGNTADFETTLGESNTDMTEAENESTDYDETVEPENGIETSEQETQSTKKPTTSQVGTESMSKSEIVAYFNTGANRVKYQAKSVTRNYTETSNDADKTELPSAVDAIGKSAMKIFMKRDDTPLVMTDRADIKLVFPVGGEDWVSKLTETDVQSARIEEKGTEYQITLRFGTQKNPSNGKGYAAVFSVLTADMVQFDYPGLSLSEQSFTYYDGEIIARFDKLTGNMTYANYRYPVIIEMTAHILGSNTKVKVGMTTVNDFSVEY